MRALMNNETLSYANVWLSVAVIILQLTNQQQFAVHCIAWSALSRSVEAEEHPSNKVRACSGLPNAKYRRLLLLVCQSQGDDVRL